MANEQGNQGDRGNDRMGMSGQQVKEGVRQATDSAREMASSAMEQGRRTAQQVAESVQGGYQSTVDTLQDFVEERPVTALLCVFGAGLLVGMVLSRR